MAGGTLIEFQPARWSILNRDALISPRPDTNVVSQGGCYRPPGFSARGVPAPRSVEEGSSE